MGERAQATVEYAGAALLVLALLLAATAAARARLTAPDAATPPTWSWPRARCPGSWPNAATASARSTFAAAAIPACARSGRPVLYVHGLQRDGFTYLEYWEYEDAQSSYSIPSRFAGFRPIQGGR